MILDTKPALLALALLFSLATAFGQGPSTRNLPLPENPSLAVESLWNLEDPALQAQLTQKLNANPQWRKLLQQQKMAVGVVDLRDPFRVKFAEINGDVMMYAASLPKIAILLAAMDAIEKGELEETPEVRSDMRLMIAKSNNQASTRMIDRLGYQKIESVLTDPRYNLYDFSHGGGLWVGKRYASQGGRNPDPLKGLSHAATVSQVCRFYYLMANGELVNYSRSQQMLEIMSNPELHHKFVNTVEKVAPSAEMYRKSGSWGNYHSDSIMVWGPEWRRYILVGLVDDPSGETILRQLVLEVEEVLQQKN